MYYKYVGNSKRAPTLKARICGIILPIFGDCGTLTNALKRYFRNRMHTITNPITKYKN
jgi:hypothetical protein